MTDPENESSGGVAPTDDKRRIGARSRADVSEGPQSDEFGDSISSDPSIDNQATNSGEAEMFPEYSYTDLEPIGSGESDLYRSGEQAGIESGSGHSGDSPRVIDPRNSMTILRFPSDVSIHEPLAILLPGETLHDNSYTLTELENLEQECEYPAHASDEFPTLDAPIDPVTSLISLQYQELQKKYEALAVKDKLIGNLLVDRYLIEAVVGTGAMAVVYRGVDQKTGAPVAVKTHRGADQTTRKRFEMEIQTHSKLNHENIVQFMEAVHDARYRRYLVMESVRGISISETLELQGRFRQPENVWMILKQVASGLEHAHSRGIIHRDLKAGNVILSEGRDGEVVAKLFDFGLSRDNEVTTRLTQVGRALGSPLYMSPEQCQGKDVSVLSDVYSLAVLAFELTTGKFPFVGLTIPDIMRSHCDPASRPISVLKHVPDFPAAQQFDAVLNKALNIRPFERFLSVTRFRKALAYWISSVRSGRTEGEIPEELLHSG